MEVIAMNREIVFAGIGGQGVLSMGTLLANAAIKEGKEVIWRPSFGGEMRGGKSTCVMNISDENIDSPVVSQYDVGVALNSTSLKKISPKIKKGGLLIWDSSSCDEPPTRTDIRSIGIPASEQALAELNDVKVMNMVMLGALVKVDPIVKSQTLIRALGETLPPMHHHMIPSNEEAIELGMSLM
jgi:2-oxoglutarate ferredoxin oxidoreductase subunit gamma